MAQAIQERALQLEASMAGRKLELIGSFFQRRDGSLTAKRRELEGLGLKVPARFAAEDDVPLSDLTGLTYRFDEPTQSIDFTVSDTGRIAKEYNLRGSATGPTPVGISGTGAVLNYSLFGAAGRDQSAGWLYQGASASFDARVYGPLGVLSQTALVTSNALYDNRASAVRLETAWTYTDTQSLITYRAGDTISGALAWTRPIRMGGFQMQRNFAVRPDLVTLPLPSVSGSAAVPTTVDVYVNNVRTVSQDVNAGPFRLTNVPIVGGNGTARVVVRDASGNTSEQSLPFFVSPDLLRGGLHDFSVEVGFPRLYYGTYSDLYSGELAGSASARYGVTDFLTVQAHGEGTRGLANGGLGTAFAVSNLALFNVAGAGSWHEGRYGGQVFASFETRIWGVSFYASTLRTIGDYEDLASVTAQPLLFGAPQAAASSQGYLGGLPATLTFRPPKAVDRISIGMPVAAIKGSVNLSYVHLQQVLGETNNIVSATYTRPLPYNGSFFATAFTDVSRSRNLSVFAGVSFPLNADVLNRNLPESLTRDVIVSSGVNAGPDGVTVGSEITKPLRQEPGSFGYRIRDTEGARVQQQRLVALGYRGNNGQVTATAMQTPSGIYGTGQLEGSVVVAGGSVFFGNRIDDAFAIVNAGAPNVDVLFDNRRVAQSGSDGKALVAGLRAYQNNKVAIDTTNLPLTAAVDTTQEYVAPRDRSGVVVDFGVKATTPSAIVILTGHDGKPLAAGLRGTTAEGEGFVVGYDGRAYISKLQPANTVTVNLDPATCTATFPFAPQADAIATIGPVACQ